MKKFQWIFAAFCIAMFLFVIGWHRGIFLSTYAETTKVKYQMVTVKKGDTLYQLSRKRNVSIAQLVKENRIANPSKIQVGQKLRVPIEKSEVASKTIVPKPEPEKSNLPTITRGKSLGTFTITASVKPANATGLTVAVDPKVIPLGSRIYIEGIGYRIAQEAGRGIGGKQIGIFFASPEEVKVFGVKENLRVEILAD